MMKGGRGKKDTAGKAARFLLNVPKQNSSTPQASFDINRTGTLPDYKDLGNWIAHPAHQPVVSRVEEANYICEVNGIRPHVRDRDCDCFFVVDSCLIPDILFPFRGDKVAQDWTVPFGSGSGTSGERLSAVVFEQMQMRVAASASPFNETCRIYSPAYRQVSVAALIHLRALTQYTETPGMKIHLAKPTDLQAALDLAYGDVRRAFVHFVDDPDNAGRPFVLAGHSQGSMHLVRLLQEEVEPYPERRDRFVHAYVAGLAVPIDIFGKTLQQIRPSFSADDICSVSSWRTTATNHPNARVLRIATYYAGKGWSKTLGIVLANNPVTWSSEIDGEASRPEEHLGAWWTETANLDAQKYESRRLPSGDSLRFGRVVKKDRNILGVEVPRLTKVDCGDVVARVDVDGIVRVPHFPEGSLFSLTERDWLLYHDLDFALFHGNLRENVAVRLQAWTNRGHA